MWLSSSAAKGSAAARRQAEVKYFLFIFYLKWWALAPHLLELLELFAERRAR